jgi:hypothetical protein
MTSIQQPVLAGQTFTEPCAWCGEPAEDAVDVLGEPSARKQRYFPACGQHMNVEVRPKQQPRRLTGTDQLSVEVPDPGRFMDLLAGEGPKS